MLCSSLWTRMNVDESCRGEARETEFAGLPAVKSGGALSGNSSDLGSESWLSEGILRPFIRDRRAAPLRVSSVGVHPRQRFLHPSRPQSKSQCHRRWSRPSAVKAANHAPSLTPNCIASQTNSFDVLHAAARRACRSHPNHRVGRGASEWRHLRAVSAVRLNAAPTVGFYHCPCTQAPRVIHEVTQNLPNKARFGP
jgi:hypothetical protein